MNLLHFDQNGKEPSWLVARNPKHFKIAKISNYWDSFAIDRVLLFSLSLLMKAS